MERRKRIDWNRKKEKKEICERKKTHTHKFKNTYMCVYIVRRPVHKNSIPVMIP